MTSTPEIVRGTDLITKDSEPKEPRGVQIILFVCGCYKDVGLTFNTEKMNRVASILGITQRQLVTFVIAAMLTGKPKVVACYKQQDVAEAKLVQLEMVIPFITGPCHSFELQQEG